MAPNYVQIDRAVDALESIAASLEKIANPAYMTTAGGELTVIPRAVAEDVIRAERERVRQEQEAIWHDVVKERGK